MPSLIEVVLEEARVEQQTFPCYMKRAKCLLRYVDRHVIDRVVMALDDPNDQVACQAAAIIAAAMVSNLPALQFEGQSPPDRLIPPLLALTGRERYWIRCAGLKVLGRCIKRFGCGCHSELIQIKLSYLGEEMPSGEFVRLVDDILSLFP